MSKASADLDKKTYSLCEAIADIAFIAGEQRYYSGDSRQDMSDFIAWAYEFEELHKDVQWGETVDSPEYIETIEKFAHEKIEKKAKAK